MHCHPLLLAIYIVLCLVFATGLITVTPIDWTLSKKISFILLKSCLYRLLRVYLILVWLCYFPSTPPASTLSCPPSPPLTLLHIPSLQWASPTFILSHSPFLQLPSFQECVTDLHLQGTLSSFTPKEIHSFSFAFYLLLRLQQASTPFRSMPQDLIPHTSKPSQMLHF